MTIKLTTILSSAALALVLAGCGGGPDGKDGKGKTTAKKDVKTDAKAKRDDKKLDKKLDDKKAGDDKGEDMPPTTAGDEPPDDKTADAAEFTDEKVVEVAQVAKDIEAKPADADAILEKAGMDRAQFDTAMADIAKDQWKSDLYIAAFTADAKG
ncbi:MAG TPA: hypothetical protein VFG69_05280 [Nannocystaceae bacterium]|nr:hypothetical protein [Nannocystaceae bacterium]